MFRINTNPFGELKKIMLFRFAIINYHFAIFNEMLIEVISTQFTAS